jgi:hypothetical protein
MARQDGVRIMSTYTNYAHNGLDDARPGIDPDFADNHLDDPRINDLPLREVGVDKVIVQRQPMPHWSESEIPDVHFPATDWYSQDNNPASPLEADKE